jgi:hypothetical protein
LIHLKYSAGTVRSASNRIQKILNGEVLRTGRAGRSEAREPPPQMEKAAGTVDSGDGREHGRSNSG